jgi:hypothetical protein
LAFPLGAASNAPVSTASGLTTIPATSLGAFGGITPAGLAIAGAAGIAVIRHWTWLHSSRVLLAYCDSLRVLASVRADAKEP